MTVSTVGPKSKAANSSVSIPVVLDGTEEGVETRMAEQSLLAIEEADVVLFMVDARAGLMPADIAIAKHLRSREKAHLPGG
ncbi:GTP-binding protein EngA [Klebsiella pneumoniae]|uniref:GTP-binding protein EngA n=1 Tax=Klebsiella pneumoniae TaxID=573 RepID=A0A377V638_KLEPN|nr:GTP-binding protein EngA [Klebsiella pneumoniae]